MLNDNIIVFMSNDRDLYKYNTSLYQSMAKKFKMYSPVFSKSEKNRRIKEVNNIDVYSMYDRELSESQRAEAMNLISSIEKKLKKSFMSILCADRHVSYEYVSDEIDYLRSKLSKEKKEFIPFNKKVLNAVYYVNKKIKEINPKFLVTYASNIHAAIFVSIANYYDIKTYSTYYSRALGGSEIRMYTCKNCHGTNFQMTKLYNELVNSDISPSKQAHIIVESFISNPTNPLPLTIEFNVWKKIRHLLGKLKNILNGNINTNTYFDSFFTSVLIYTIKYILKFKFQYTKFTKEPTVTEKEKFAYFALGQQPELVLLEMAPEYIDQLNSVKQLSRYIPYQTKLLVREHPFNIGRRTLSFVKKIFSLGNVIVGSSIIPAFNYIKKAESVITINGTTGWEAILYKKPVFKFERTFYDVLGLAKDLRNYKDIEKNYKEHVDFINSYNNEEYYNKIKLFIDAEMKTTFRIDETDELVDFIGEDSLIKEDYNYWKEF